jgi:hypothetical protein
VDIVSDVSSVNSFVSELLMLLFVSTLLILGSGITNSCDNGCVLSAILDASPESLITTSSLFG